MSIFFDFQVGPSGRRFRRAVNGDRYDIELFLNSEYTENIFGTVDIGSLIELATLAICMINEANEVVGFMALKDYPNVKSVDPAEWETWMRNMFTRFYLARNTLFIHFMCCKDSVIQYFLSEALTSVFQNDVYLLHIVLMVPNQCTQEDLARYEVLKKRNMCMYFTRLDDDRRDDVKMRYMCVALRQDHCPKLKIRQAVEEDNDDICEILDKKSPRLKEIYGDYYISELVGRHPESQRKIIVAEHHDKVVGVMCLSPTINYKKLQRIYNLRSYYGLQKATPLEKERLKRSNVLLSTFGEPIMMGKWSPFEGPISSVNYAKSADNVSQETPKGKVNFRKRSSVEMRNRYRIPSTLHHSVIDVVQYNTSDDYSGVLIKSPTVSQATVLSNTAVMLEADPFDYDIVNIDTSLLNIAPSFDRLSLKSIRSSVQSRISSKSLRRTRKRAPLKPPKDDTVLYRGSPNAFMIELFGLHEDVDERCAIDLLEVAFQVMKIFDYCIIRVPSAEASFPLLEHFSLVPTKTRICCTYSLYVAHQASVMGKLRVREAEFVDIAQIARFFQNIQAKDTLWTIENCIMQRQDRQAYVFMSGLSLVGFGILEPPEKLTFLQAKFNMDPYHNTKYHQPGSGSKIGFSAIDIVLVYPVFEPHFRFFAREMMRLSGSHSLVWMTAYRNKWVAHKANSIVSAMVPLIPRKFDMDIAEIPELMKLSAFAKNIMAFSSWYLDKKMTSCPMAHVSTRIVVLGASRTALAFLNTLLFGNSCTYLSFTNITLISANGLPYIRHSSTPVEMMFPKDLITTDKYLKSVPYTYYMNVVQGTMTDINKTERYIALSNGGRYYYDLLFLLFGKQYQHPNYLKPLPERDMKCENYARLDIPRATFEPELLNYDTPENVFIINNIGQANKALKFVKTCFTEECHSKILVYGATIHTYCCLAALLEMNVPAENIVFIEPFPHEDPYKTRVSVFYNANVDETVSQMIDSLNIKVYRSYYFQSWSATCNFVTHVNFLSHFQMLTLECTVFFYYGKRGVNTEAFLAVNRCGMGFDGGILIDHEFRTKDPCIYAAGPGTAYFKKYYASTMKQKYYDSYDVGNKLGNYIKTKLDPFFSDKYQQTQKKDRDRDSVDSIYLNSAKSETSTVTPISAQPSLKYEFTHDKLPNLLKPKVMHCRLPGGLQYLEVRSPGKKIPHYYLQSLGFSGIVMETFKGGYFKIHMTKDLIVDGLTCLTPDRHSIENFKNIYGLPSVVLNNVHLRYSTKKLDNFFEFFRSPWAFFLYHDQADELFAMVKELLPKGQSSGDTIQEALRKVGNTGSTLSASEYQAELRKKIEEIASLHLEAITDYVLEWLSENDVLLPMYLQPSQRIEFDHDLERNQVFRRKKLSIINLISKIV